MSIIVILLFLLSTTIASESIKKVLDLIIHHDLSKLDKVIVYENINLSEDILSLHLFEKPITYIPIINLIDAVSRGVIYHNHKQDVLNGFIDHKLAENYNSLELEMSKDNNLFTSYKMHLNKLKRLECATRINVNSACVYVNVEEKYSEYPVIESVDGWLANVEASVKEGAIEEVINNTNFDKCIEKLQTEGDLLDNICSLYKPDENNNEPMSSEFYESVARLIQINNELEYLYELKDIYEIYNSRTRKF